MTTDEAKLWDAYRASRTAADRNRLVMFHLDLAHTLASVALARLPRHVEKAEVRSWAVLGLIQAVDRYDPAEGVRFSNFAYPRIRGSIGDEVRRLRGRSRAMVRDGVKRPRHVPIHAGIAARAEREALPSLESMVVGLTHQQRKAVLLRFGEGLEMREIGERIGVSASRVCRVVGQSIEKLGSLGMSRLMGWDED